MFFNKGGGNSPCPVLPCVYYFPYLSQAACCVNVVKHLNPLGQKAVPGQMRCWQLAALSNICYIHWENLVHMCVLQRKNEKVFS